MDANLILAEALFTLLIVLLGLAIYFTEAEDEDEGST